MASKPKRKAIWFDPETAAVLDAIAEQLAEKLGFKPTPSQVIRHILRGQTTDGNSKNQYSSVLPK